MRLVKALGVQRTLLSTQSPMRFTTINALCTQNNFTVGTPEEVIRVICDTGSTDLSVPSVTFPPKMITDFTVY